MKLVLVKTLSLVAFVMTISTSTMAGLIDKEGLLEMIGNAMDSNLCSSDYNACLEVSEATCKAETKTLLRDKCSNDVPNDLEDIDEVREYSSIISACVAYDYVGKHKNAMAKNKSTMACKKIKK